MREIKFRSKRKDNDRWVYGSLLRDGDGKNYIVDALYGECTACSVCGKQEMDIYEVDPKTVGQYTGLNDKNGKEIYEGDIVKANMDFGPGGMAEQTTSIYWDENVGGWQFNYFDKATIEIIGNIHDNPELLEEHYDY